MRHMFSASIHPCKNFAAQCFRAGQLGALSSLVDQLTVVGSESNRYSLGTMVGSSSLTEKTSSKVSRRWKEIQYHLTWVYSHQLYIIGVILCIAMYVCDWLRDVCILHSVDEVWYPVWLALGHLAFSIVFSARNIRSNYLQHCQYFKVHIIPKMAYILHVIVTRSVAVV